MVADAGHVNVASIEACNHLLSLKHRAYEARANYITREKCKAVYSFFLCFLLVVAHGSNKACSSSLIFLVGFLLYVVDIVEVKNAQLSFISGRLAKVTLEVDMH